MKEPECFNYYERKEVECMKCTLSDNCRKSTAEFTLERLDLNLTDIGIPKMIQSKVKEIIEALADKYDLDLIVYEKE